MDFPDPEELTMSVSFKVVGWDVEGDACEDVDGGLGGVGDEDGGEGEFTMQFFWEMILQMRMGVEVKGSSWERTVSRGVVRYGDFDPDVLLFRCLAVLRTESRYNSTF
jgi:hypothetical protein